MLELSHTKLGMYRGCSMKYKFKYEQGLEPIMFLPKMKIGSVLHEAIDRVYKGEDEGDIISFIMDEFDEAIGKAELTDQETLLIAKFTALGMFVNYPWKDLSPYTSIESELPFSVRVGNTRSVRFVGKIDRMLETKGRFWVNELKTTGLSQRQFDSRSQTSFQGTAYSYAAHKMGYDPAGIMFNVIKRPMLRKFRDETTENFGKRIFKDYSDPKKQAHYYQRVLSYRNADELALFEQDFQTVVRDFRWRRYNDRYYRNTDECWNFNQECPYKKICFTRTRDPLTIQLFYKQREKKDDKCQEAKV